MNDTDAVIARGIFPVGEAASLCIISEVVTVTLTKHEVEVRRSYEVKNRGPKGTFAIGTIWKLNSVSLAPEDCGVVTLDGDTLDVGTGVAYLRDVGDAVEVEERSIDEVTKRLVGIDGTVVGQVWSWFDVEFEAGETIRIEISFAEMNRKRSINSRVANQLCLYSEKFWACDVVPRIELRLGTDCTDLDIASLTPKGNYAQYSIPPGAVDNGFIVWRQDNYRPNKVKYSYTHRILHSSSIDLRAIREALEDTTRK
jgi:hypothetical protein